jgi:hypothetical protein
MKRETPHAIFMVSKNKNKFWVAVFFAITTNCKKKKIKEGIFFGRKKTKHKEKQIVF